MSIDSLFKHNLGMVDRVIRVVVGLILVGNVYAGIQTPVGWVGLILILTGTLGICPIYAVDVEQPEPNGGYKFGGSLSDLAEVVALAESGRVRPRIQQYSFDQIEQAYQALHDGKIGGRAVIVPE